MFKTLNRGGALGGATVIKEGVLIVTYNDSVPQTKYVEISYSTVKGPRMELYIRKNANKKKCEVAVDLTLADLDWSNDNNPAFICVVMRDKLRLRLDLNADRPDLSTHVGDWQAIIMCSIRPAETFAVRCISLPYPGPAVIHAKEGQASLKVDYFTHRVMKDYTDIEEVEVHDTEITLQVNRMTISLLAVRPTLVYQCLKRKVSAVDGTRSKTFHDLRPPCPPPAAVSNPMPGYAPMGYTPMSTFETVSSVDESEYFVMSSLPVAKIRYPSFGMNHQRSVDEADYLTYDPENELDDESIYFDPSLVPLPPQGPTPFPRSLVEPPPVPLRPSGPLSSTEFKDELVKICGQNTSPPLSAAPDQPFLPKRTGAEVIRTRSRRDQKPRIKKTRRPKSMVKDTPGLPPPQSPPDLPSDMLPPPDLPSHRAAINVQDLPPPPPRSISASPLSPPLPKRRVEAPRRTSIDNSPKFRPPIQSPDIPSPRLNYRPPPPPGRPPLPPPTTSPPPPPRSERPPLPPPTATISSPPLPGRRHSLESPYMDQTVRRLPQSEAPPELRQRPCSTILADGTVYTLTRERPSSMIDRSAPPPTRPSTGRGPLPPHSSRSPLQPPPSEAPSIPPPSRRGPLPPPPPDEDRPPLLPPNSKARPPMLPPGSSLNRRVYR